MIAGNHLIGFAAWLAKKVDEQTVIDQREIKLTCGFHVNIKKQVIYT